jgi:Tol biopolymer transport system component
MRAIVSPRQGFASGLLVVFTVVAPALAPLDHALGASRAPGPSTRASAGWLVFSRFDPKIDDDATFVRTADGTRHRLWPGASNSPHWSPDGARVAIAACADPPECNTAVVLVDPVTRESTSLPMPAPDRVFTSCLTWTPNGRRLACEGFGVDKPELNGVYTIRASDGGDLRRVTWNRGDDDNPADYSPNGHRLLFVRTQSGRPDDTNSALYVKNLRRGGVHRITPWGFSDGEADWSPDGRRVAFEHRGRLYYAFPNGDRVRKVRLKTVKGYGAGDFAWSPTGRRLVFLLVTPKPDGDYREGLATARADGTHVRWVTTSPTFDHQPDWRP